MIVQAAARVQAARRLAAAGIEGAAGEAALLLGHVLGCDRAALLRDRDRLLPPAQQARFAALVARRAAREPLAHLLGMREFWSLPFQVSPAVLIPRPDSETVVAAALALAPEATRLLDLGTGSGCLLLSLLHERRALTGVGVDLSPAAAVVAAGNARALGLADRAAVVVSSWDAALAPTATFDLIVSNPPYIAAPEWPALAPEVADHDPTLALAGGGDGLAAYRALAPVLARRLRAGGVALLEHGATQGPAVAALITGAGLRYDGARTDLAGHERVQVFRAC